MRNQPKERKKFEDKEASEMLEEIFGAFWTGVWKVLGFTALIAGVAALFNPELGKRKRIRKAAGQVAGWAGAKVGGELAFALGGLLIITKLQWPVTIIFGMIKSAEAFNRYHAAGVERTFSLFQQQWLTVMIPVFILFLILKVMEKMWVIAMIPNVGAVGLTHGFLTGTKVKDSSKLANALGAGLNSIGAWFQKAQNTGGWFTASVLLLTAIPYFASWLHPYLLMIPSALCVCWIWEINTSGGNNRALGGLPVVERWPNGRVKWYPVWDSKRNKVVGRPKPALAGFQGAARGWLAGYIAAAALIAVVCGTVDIGRSQLDAHQAEVVTAMVAKWEKGNTKQIRALNRQIVAIDRELMKRDSLETAKRQLLAMQPADSLNHVRVREFNLDRDAKIRVLNDRLAAIPSRGTLQARKDALLAQIADLESADTEAYRDSITDVVESRGVEIFADQVKVGVAYTTPDSLPPPGLEGAALACQNGWNGMKAAQEKNGYGFFIYAGWLFVAGVACYLATRGIPVLLKVLAVAFALLGFTVMLAVPGFPGLSFLLALLVIAVLLHVFGKSNGNGRKASSTAQAGAHA